MTVIPLTLPTSSVPARFSMEGNSRLVNCYVEPTDGAKAQQTIYAASGLDLDMTVPNGGTASGPTGIRCMLVTDDYLYTVGGRKLTATDKFGVKTTILTLPGDGDVFMARNRRSPTPQVGLVSDGVYRVITGTTIATVTDPDLPPPTAISVIDGYFLLPTTFDRVFITGEDDATTISALDFGKAQKQPDATIYALGGERDAVIFGENSIEWWNDSPDGTGNFPFVPVANINLGCSGAKTVIQLDRAIAWLANDGTARLMDGYSGKRISDHPQERDFAKAQGTVYGFGFNDTSTGHAWLVWRCETWAWAYNLRTGLWNELEETHTRTSWRGCNAVRWQGKTLVGDYEDGRIYRVDYGVDTWGGEAFTMEINLASAHVFPRKMRLNTVYVDAVTGVGKASRYVTTSLLMAWASLPFQWAGTGAMQWGNTARNDPDADPMLMLATSADGGKTFGSNRHISLGRSGDRIKRLRSYRFGQFGAQGCTLKLSCSASVARAISGVSIDVDELK